MPTPWETIYERFDPELPAEFEWRSDRAYSPVAEIARGLARPFGDKRYMVHGTIGTGKSTELLELARQRSGNDFVVVIDLYRHFDERVGDIAALQTIQPWEVVFLCGLYVHAAAERVVGHRWDRAVVKNLADARAAFGQDGQSKPTIDIAKLAKALVVSAGGPMAEAAQSGLQVVGAVAGAAKWELPIGLPGRSPALDQDHRVQRMLAAVNAMIGEIQRQYRPMTIFIDGLDRIVGADPNRALFVDSTLLSKLVCSTIVTASVALRRKALAGLVRVFETCVLANVPVMQQDEPKDPSDAVQFFVRLFHKRVDDLGATGSIPTQQLERLAYYCGGRVREFVRLVRLVAVRAYDAGSDVATTAMVDEAIDERRRVVEMGINAGHLRTLQSVIDHPLHQLPEDEGLDDLLNQFWLLPYPNQSEWYFPHPLLTLSLLKLT